MDNITSDLDGVGENPLPQLHQIHLSVMPTIHNLEGFRINHA